ncbi:MAG: transglycosylase domain-containing protein [Patescibacteria group bacterium]
MKLDKKIWLIVLSGALLLLVFGLVGLRALNARLLVVYQANQSFELTDRNDHIFFMAKNPQGYYAQYSEKIPIDFKNLLLKKEDRYFYWHFGFNFWGILQVVGNELGLSPRKASSTISQQLVKILLAQENQRNMANKIKESFFTLALEIFNSKDNILKMYANSIYLGNQLQGIESASQGYFNAAAENLTPEQTIQLLATINSPSNSNPTNELNAEKAKTLSNALGVKNANLIETPECQTNLQNYLAKNNPILELAAYLPERLTQNQQLTIDSQLTQKIRSIVASNLDILKDKKAKNAAVVILSAPSNQIIALIGSPDPSSLTDGYQIDMSKKPRQIGSTIKPFIYLLGFEAGMRPYSLIDDREYKYLGDMGYPIYPKNYDFQYHGEMTAHYALANSINVAAVKALEFVGVENFNRFLIKDLSYQPVQPIDQYQLGIALGGLEMSLLNLTHYFSIFPNQGKLANLKIFSNDPVINQDIAPQDYISLINKILSDRQTGIDQFGAVSSLNLPSNNYALKTGTSHDYTDSWVIGYTPDFLVGVWVGNADNSPMEAVSGQVGAGSIWHEIMQIMLNSDYNKKTPFDFSDIKEYQGANGIEFGLANDDFVKARDIIKQQDQAFILSPHNNDVFIFQPQAEIALKAKATATWTVNGQNQGTGQTVFFAPKEKGSYQITASSTSQSETITVQFINR